MVHEAQGNGEPRQGKGCREQGGEAPNGPNKTLEDTKLSRVEKEERKTGPRKQPQNQQGRFPKGTKVRGCGEDTAPHAGIKGVKAEGEWQGDRCEVQKVTLALEFCLRRQRPRQLETSCKGQQVTLMTSNVGGSREALAWALEQEVEVLLIQEHRMLGQVLQGAMSQARWKGWAGVWEPAQTSGRQSRIGGACDAS